MRCAASTAALVMLCTATLSGCESLDLLPHAGSDGSDGKLAEEERRRQRYLKSRDPQDLRWLLANRVEPGQSPDQVASILGEPGIRVPKGEWMRDGNGGYREGDVPRKWGPDREGNSTILVFRDGKLVNFDPAEFREG